jgi:hypothetical protein
VEITHDNEIKKMAIQFARKRLKRESEQLVFLVLVGDVNYVTR